jgi:hypothetical protein
VPEVHPVDVGEQGRHGPDRDPGRDPAHVVFLPHRDLGQVGLERVGEQVAEAVGQLDQMEQVGAVRDSVA